MLFNTVPFFIFLAIVLVLFYAASRALRKWILLSASYFFYMSWNPKFIALLLTLTAIDYTAAIMMERGAKIHRKLFLILGLTANLGFLGFFKYYNFLGDNLALLLGRPPHSFALAHHSSARHQLSYLPKHVVHHRRVSRRTESDPQPDRLRAVHRLFPATGGRTDRSRARILQAICTHGVRRSAKNSFAAFC